MKYYVDMSITFTVEVDADDEEAAEEAAYGLSGSELFENADIGEVEVVEVRAEEDDTCDE